MCGFAGLYGFVSQNIQVQESLLTRLSKAIIHRGPDDQRTFYDEQHELALVAARLGINDLSAAANMPFVRLDLGLALVYNGEIYNYKELKHELELLGYTFSSHGDTEVVLVAYKAWGAKAFEKFEGMFACVLYNFDTRQLLLVRDRVGVKPLYFTAQRGVIAFASELKAFDEIDWIKKDFSPIAWYHYLTFMSTPAPYTIFKDIYKLPAGYMMTVDNLGRMSFSEWYNPARDIDKAPLSEAAAIEHIDMLLRASVKKRMVADVPVGAFLSGGLDSSLITVLMSEHAAQIKTFTIGFEESTASNEFGWAQRVAAQCGAEYNQVLLNESAAFSYYPKMIKDLDEPLADPVCLPFYFVSKAAHHAGLKVVQVGEGADELFFGYAMYARYAHLHNSVFQKMNTIIPARLRQAVSLVAEEFYHNQPFKRELIASWRKGEALFWGGALAFGETQKQEMFGPRFEDDSIYDTVVDQIYPGLTQSFNSHTLIEYHLKKLHAFMPEADYGQKMLYLELKHRLPELLLMRADKMSMANSLEAREPFLDHHLLEYMMSVPVKLKYKNKETKYLLKKVAERYLPHDIVYRKKVGFGAPTAWWFAQGTLFPNYYQRLARDVAKRSPYFGFLHPIDITLNKNSSHRAVQNWTLQQLWAFTREYVP